MVRADYAPPTPAAPIFVRKTDQQGTFQDATDVTGLAAAVQVGTYTFRVNLQASAPSADDMRFGWTVPAGTTYFAAALNLDSTQNFYPRSANSTSNNPTAFVTVAGTGTAVAVVIEGTFIVTQAGTVQLRFHNASGGGAGQVTVYPGSYIELLKVA
jgi:hypothetical protein